MNVRRRAGFQLGATRSWSGHDNHASAVLFSLALTTLVWWKNGAGAVELAASLCYVVCVLAYVGVVAYAVRHGTWSEREHRVLVLTQKAMAYVSMMYVAFVTLRVRRSIIVTHG